MLAERRWAILNIDSTIFAQAPRMAPFREAMRRAIADALALDPSQVNVKATTSEGLGAFGRGEGIGASAIALISAEPPADNSGRKPR
jgi:2-C-methyl-D-erythritol 2,4-cyclodiphosphate synthase